MPLTLNPPPTTPVEPVTEILHGVPITDPYRWLEDQNSLRTRKWLEEQTDCARAYFDALPGRGRIRKRVEQLMAVETISEPWKVGNRYFFLKRAPHQEQPVIVTREDDSAEEVILLDPAKRDQDTHSLVRILNISSDGNLLAYGVSRSDLSHLTEFLDVSSMEILPDRLPAGCGYGLVFSRDNKNVYYSHELADSARPYYRAAYKHEFGTTLDTDVEIFVAGEDPQIHLELLGSTDGRFLAFCVFRGRDPLEYSFYVQEIGSRKPPRKILDQTGSVFKACFVGSHVIALTDWEAPNLRIVRFEVDDLAQGHWIEVVPEGTNRINEFCVADHHICVSRVVNLSSRIEVYDESGHRQDIDLCSSNGTVRLFRRPIASDTLFYAFSSFGQPSTIFSWSPASAQRKLWAQTQVPFDPSSVEVEQTRYKSKDGTEIPISLAFKKSQNLAYRRPTLLTGYGGFGSSRTPQFAAYSTFLIENGFLVALAHLRGGGEFGVEWHHAAKRHNRQTAIDDFVSAAEWLIARGLAAPQEIVIGGMSNGGLLVGAAFTQRPDLFRAVVCVGPLMDMIRYHLFDDADYMISEYGCSENQEDFQHLFAYSPYHHVETNVSYPSVLMVSGDLDKICNPMHARKMVARLQAATCSGRPVLLDYGQMWGHLPTQPLSQRIEAVTDRLAFICHEVGAHV